MSFSSLELEAFNTAAHQTEDGKSRIEIGPSHPGIQGAIKLSVSLDGETIVDLKPEIGYLHRGFEKQAESYKYLQILPLTDRLNHNSAIINNCAYSMAIEKLFEVQIPPRAEYARVIMSEVSRIADHLTCVSSMMSGLGNQTFFLWGIKAREFLWELVEEFSGARLTSSWTRFGGNVNDFPEGFLAKLRDRLEKVEETIEECDRLVSKSRIFVDRMKNVGTISKEKAVSFGFSGPILRACGVAHDLRVFAGGYSVYGDFDFEIPIGEVGDCYDRYLVRIEEIRQSISIINQAKSKIPSGDYYLNDPQLTLPAEKERSGSLEEDYKLTIEGHKPPAGEAYSAVEGANGELGFFIVSNGSANPVKCRVRSPSFNAVAALSEMTKFQNLADLMPILSSINMVGGELDR